MLREALVAHWSLSDRLGAHYTQCSTALRAASLLETSGRLPDIADITESHILGNWARHAPPPESAPPMQPQPVDGTMAETLEAFREKLYTQEPAESFEAEAPLVSAQEAYDALVEVYYEAVAATKNEYQLIGDTELAKKSVESFGGRKSIFSAPRSFVDEQVFAAADRRLHFRSDGCCEMEEEELTCYGFRRGRYRRGEG